MFFSIIVPIYKVEKYLEDAIKSVLNQQFQDYELILVDDGSPDKCPEICEEYKKKDSRIKVVHKANGGLSDARNAGLEIASGEYIVFLDSDDLLNTDILKKAYDEILLANKPELLIGTLTHLIEGVPINMAEFPQKIIISDYNNINNLCEAMIKEMNRLPWTAYQNIYKRSFLEKWNYRFDKDINGAEDCDFFMRIIDNVKEYKVISDSLVLYRVAREGSIITNPSFSAIKGQLKVFAESFYRVDSRYKDPIYMKSYFANRFTNIIILIACLKNDNEIKECVDIISRNKKILKYTKGNKYIVAKVFWKLFGFYKGSLLLNKYR